MGQLTPRQVADYFLWKVQPEYGDTMSNLKLQKLLYYAQGFHLAIKSGYPLFSEDVLAWTYGPVVRSVYNAFKEYDAGSIPKPADFDPNVIPEDTAEILDDVFNVYGQFSAWRLVEMTHEEPPWRDTELNEVITREAMRDFFTTLVVDA
jgi:uncharacterized phage-associated protein